MLYKEIDSLNKVYIFYEEYKNLLFHMQFYLTNLTLTFCLVFVKD